VIRKRSPASSSSKSRRPRSFNGKQVVEAKQGVLDINPGTYTVRFENKKLKKTVERPVEVKSGHTAFVQVDLLHEEEAPKP
jgi:hypothetical protein